MRPFRDMDTFFFFDEVIQEVITKINSLNNEYFLKASPTELEEYYIDKILIKPLILHSNDHYIKNQTGIQIDVSNDI